MYSFIQNSNIIINQNNSYSDFNSNYNFFLKLANVEELQMYPGIRKNKYKKKTIDVKKNQDNFNIENKKSKSLKKFNREKILRQKFINSYKKSKLRQRNKITEKFLFKEFTENHDLAPAKKDSLYISQQNINYANTTIEEIKFKSIYYISKK
jgi:hypothetical protein